MERANSMIQVRLESPSSWATATKDDGKNDPDKCEDDHSKMIVQKRKFNWTVRNLIHT
jgi:hypothetical protein